MNTSAVEIRGLEKRFRQFALGPLDMTVPRGAIYGLIGPNGAGKTVTMDLMLRMGATDAGSITMLGLDHVRDEVAVKQQVGYVSPELNYRAWGTVRRAVEFVRSFYPTWDDEYCGRLVEAFQLDWKDRISTLSLGNVIKLSLLLALSHRPRLLILDEPTVGLDAVAKQQVFAELLAAVQNEDRTVVISSHGLGDLERFADHVGMIKQGRMLFEGATADVVERFRMVDFVTDRTPPSAWPAGVTVVAQEGPRGRALVDGRSDAAAWMAGAGLREVDSAPVTLEELFVTMAKAS